MWRVFVVLARARRWLPAAGGALPQPLALAEICAGLDELGPAEAEARRDWLALLQAADAGYLEGALARRPARRPGAGRS